MFLKIEAGLSLLALVLAFTVPNLGSRWFEAIEQKFGKLSRKRGLSVIVVGLTALALRAALLPMLPIPQPCVHDEFGYLLLSDTFAHGRLTSPTSPMWVHFESFHIIWQPTYTAKYYPAQGLIMALGQVVTGHPFWGVWLSVGLMCAAITWMLQAWVGEGWALLGGFLAVIRFGTFNYWANSYWGGAVAATGGALVLGALPRIKQNRRVRDALLMGLGFAILANSRPYEGLFFGIPVAVAMLLWLWKMKRPDLAQALRRVMVPLLAVLALTLVAMGYYFWRVTGSPFNTPYFVYEHTYNPVPYFPWQRPRPFPTYRYQTFKTFYEFYLRGYEFSHSVMTLAYINVLKVALLWEFYVGFALSLSFIPAAACTPYGLRWEDISAETRMLTLFCGATVLAEALPIWYNPHYSAQATGAIFALVLIAFRRIRQWEWRAMQVGMFLTRAAPSICIVLFVLRTAAGPLHLPLPRPWPKESIPTWCSPNLRNQDRIRILTKLRAQSGRYLVIVHYSPDHDVFFHEWVYNRADLASARVIWAHDMGPEKNEELIRYYKDRRVWLLFADDQPPKLVPYSEAADTQAQADDLKGP